MLKKALFAAGTFLLISACGLFSQPQEKVDITAIPSRTPSPIATPTDEVSLFINTTEDLDQILPDDILDEIAFYSGGGGGGFSCEDAGEQAVFVSDSVEIMQLVRYDVCNVPLEEFSIQIMQPDGKVIFAENNFPSEFKNTRKNDNKTFTSFTSQFFIGFDASRGAYTITFTGKNWGKSAIFNVVEPDSPRLYEIRDKHQLIFYHFKPNDEIKFLFYQQSESRHSYTTLRGWDVASLKGWKQLKAGADGNLTIGFDIRDFMVTEQYSTYFLLAFGSESGEVRIGSGFGIVYVSDVSCGNVKSVGIHSGDVVRVLADKLPLVSNGLYGDNFVLGNLKKGDIVEILAGPNCRDGKLWWQMVCPDKFCKKYPYAYPEIIESENGHSTLQTITASNANIPACTGARTTRLSIGMNAKVNVIDTGRLSLKAEPKPNAKQDHVIASGRKMVILDGPVCADRSYWWRIRSEQGFEGWAREGDHEDYWIDPLP